jgi:hypothetical protein
MPGTYPTNLHQGSRAEVLADYLFSTWGTVTPVRRSDDHGADLYCTLTERIGQLSVVRAYYSVQVKSNTDPWHLKTTDEVNWLFDYPTPLFLACVDQAAVTLSVYQTMPRYLAGMWPETQQLELIASQVDEGKCAQWESAERFDLSAPILRVTLANLVRSEMMEQFHKVLGFWVQADADASMLRRMGLLRFWMPHRYRVNEVPSGSNVQQGMTRPSENHRAAGVRTAVEVLDYIGDQLLRAKDTEAAIYAAWLLRRLVERDPQIFADHLVLRDGGPAQFENTLGFAVNALLQPPGENWWLRQGLNLLQSALRNTEPMRMLLKPAEAAPGDQSEEQAGAG